MKRATSSLINAAALAAALGLGGPVLGAQSGYGNQATQPRAAQPMGGSPQAHRGQPTGTASKASFAHWAQGKQVKDITGKELFGRSGAKLGKIDAVVQNRMTKQADAVLKVGGFFGLGGRHVTVPLSNIDMENGKLTAPSVANVGELEKQEPYRKSRYKKVSQDQQLSEFSAFEVKPSGSSPGGR
jgi:hypothetical protein